MEPTATQESERRTRHRRTAVISPARMTDDRLAKAAIDGDEDAFAAFCDRYQQRIYTYCYRICGSPDDASDAMQETFIKVFQRIPKLEDREHNLRAYLFAAARSASFDKLRDRSRSRPTDEIPEPTLAIGGGTAVLPAIEIDPERSALLKQSQIDVREAHSRLPDRYREVLALRELEGASYSDIGEIVGMNANSVAQLIYRARLQLKRELLGEAVSAYTPATADCERALPLIVMADDGELRNKADDKWLNEHLEECEHCRAARSGMQEAAASYRAWIPAAAAPLLLTVDDAQAAAASGGSSATGVFHKFVASRTAKVAAGVLIVAAIGGGAALILASETAAPVNPVVVDSSGADVFVAEKPSPTKKASADKPKKKAQRKAKKSSSSSSSTTPADGGSGGTSASTSLPTDSGGSGSGGGSTGSSGGSSGASTGSAGGSGGGGGTGSGGSGGSTGTGGGTGGGSTGGGEPPTDTTPSGGDGGTGGGPVIP